MYPGMHITSPAVRDIIGSIVRGKRRSLHNVRFDQTEAIGPIRPSEVVAHADEVSFVSGAPEEATGRLPDGIRIPLFPSRENRAPVPSNEGYSGLVTVWIAVDSRLYATVAAYAVDPLVKRGYIYVDIVGHVPGETEGSAIGLDVVRFIRRVQVHVNEVPRRLYPRIRREID